MVRHQSVLCLFLAPLTMLVAASGLSAPTPPTEEDVADYEIDVSLDPELHRLEGAERLRWTNRSDTATDEIYLHLYLNAFAGPHTTFMRELRWRSLRARTEHDDGWGWIQIGRLTFDDGSDLLTLLEFVRPDDENPDDFTLARVSLPRVVEPGEVIELELEFEAQLPWILARTGHVGDFHLVAQWFPKIAVLSDRTGWNTRQFHAASEFFADFGNYLVTITVPESWIIGATGVEVRNQTSTDGHRTVVYRAQRVHDFAWCAAPPNLMEVVEADFEPGRDVPMAWFERAQSLLGLSPADLELPPVQLRFVVPVGQRLLVPRMIRAARLAIAWYGLHYGAYPYPLLTVVSPPKGAEEAGGMEYPTFMTTGADHLDAIPPFEWSSDVESVTVHEFGHQYFYGLVASNEFAEGWLDEGITTYTENACLTAITTDGLVPAIADFDFWAAERIALSLSNLPVTIATRSWEFRHPWRYYLASYTKTALVLRTLEGLIGPQAMARGLRTYVERFSFRHPTGDDLVDVLSEAAGRDLGPFFAQAVDGDAVPDWAILSVRQRRPFAADGFEWDGAAWHEIGSAAAQDESEWDPEWEIDLDLARRGDFVGPVEVELTWSDETVERRTWNGRTRWVRWRFEGERRLEQVVIDPDTAWVLETRRADNYWRRQPAEPDHPLWWVRQVFELARQVFLRFS